MIKLRTIIIVVIIYMVAYLSLKYNVNLLYPYNLLKDYLIYPVLAIIDNSNNIEYDNKQLESIINELKNDINDIKALSGIKTISSDFAFINASVLERNRTYWFNSLRIDKGSIDGIQKDMAVINEKGLIGRINEVNKYTSEIKLITTNDVNNKISVVISNDNENIYGILSGYDSENNHLIVTLTSKSIEVLNNSLVKTTGIGGVFPSGILVGEVVDSKYDQYDVGKIVLVKPIVNIKEIRYVSILKRN